MAYKIRPDVAEVVMDITNSLNFHGIHRGRTTSPPLNVHWGQVMGWLSGCGEMDDEVRQQWEAYIGTKPKFYKLFRQLMRQRQGAGVGGEMGFYYDAVDQEGYFYPHNNIPNVSDKILDWSGGMFVNSEGKLVDETGWLFAPYLYYNATSPPTINYDFLR